MISTSDFTKGMILNIEDQPWVIVDFQFVSPGKGSAFFRTKLKNMKTEKVVERTFKSGEKFEESELTYKKASYLYSDRQNSVFLIKNDNQRVSLPIDSVKDKVIYLRQNSDIDLLYVDDELLSLNIPKKVSLKITEAAPAIKGNTSGGAFKTVKLETGLEVNVPIFIKEGEVIRINTESGEYVERANE
ncbi:MAG: elongation factor P [Candidatus Parcubacteria bacterium]|nr:elongation factor P [Candidatus Parcubacteria bacterium]